MDDGGACADSAHSLNPPSEERGARILILELGKLSREALSNIPEEAQRAEREG